MYVPNVRIEEIAVRELETIFSSAEEFNKWYAEISANPELKGNWQKFCEWISQVIEDIKKVFMSEGKKAELAELENIKGLLANAIKGAENAAQERASKVQAKQGAEAKSSTNLENQIKEEYNEVASHSLKKKAPYNEYITMGMKWAYSSDTQIGDRKVLYKPRIGKFVLVEATKEDVGFIELKSGAREQLRKDEKLYESNKQGEFADNEGNIDTAIHNFEAGQNNNTRDNVDAGDRGKGIQNAEVFEGKPKSNGAADTQTTDGNLEKGNFSLKGNGNNNLTVGDEGDIPNKNDLKTKIKYSPTGIKLPSNEYAKFHSSTSTDYYKAYKTHEGLQYQSCVTDDTHILYIYEDGGFGKYNVVARVDYKYGDVATKVMEVLNNEKHYQITGVVNYILQTFEVRRSGYTVYNTYTKKRISSRGDGTLLKGTQESHAGRVDASSSGISGNKRGAGVNGNTGRGVNGSASYLLKQWHTGLTKSQIEDVEKWVRRAGRPESKRITDKTYWYKGRLNGRDLFVIYSTEDADDPTVLYLSRGEKAKEELEILMDLLEEYENGESINGKSAYVSWVSGSGWLQKINSNKNNLQHMGNGKNNQNAGVLPGQPKRNGSPAFRNVIEDCFRIQERDGGVNKSHSLKGGIQNPSKWTKEFLDTIEDVRDGKKNAESRLYKYVEDGTLSTKDYDELIEKYGAIPSGENPHREVQVPRKTADGKKVSQTVSDKTCTSPMLM